MYLLLGDPQDPLCLSVRTVLEARHYPTQITANPLAQLARLAWRLNKEHSASQLGWDDEPPLPDDHISGVLVRSTG